MRIKHSTFGCRQRSYARTELTVARLMMAAPMFRGQIMNYIFSPGFQNHLVMLKTFLKHELISISWYSHQVVADIAKVLKFPPSDR